MMERKQRIRRFLLPLTLLIVLLGLLWPIKTQATEMLLQHTVDGDFDGTELVQATDVDSRVDILADLQIDEDIASRIPEDVFVYQDTPPIPIAIDGSTTCGGNEIVRQFNVTQSFRVQRLSIAFNADHTRRGDIRVTLTPPSGTGVQTIIAEDSSDSWDNYDVMLDDSAGLRLNDGNDDDTGLPFYDRAARASVSSLTGAFGAIIDAQGVWELSICDTQPGAEHGAYNRSVLIFESPFSCVPTIRSATSGDWNDATTWQDTTTGLPRLPKSSDVVEIGFLHTVNAPSGSVPTADLCDGEVGWWVGPSPPPNPTTIAGLCNYGTLQSQPGQDLVLGVTGEIQNHQIIRGLNGNTGTGSTCGDKGSSIQLWGQPVFNGNGALIQAGDGGDGQQCGGDGGDLFLYGQDTTNRGTVSAGNGGNVTGTAAGSAGNGGHADIWGKTVSPGDLINTGTFRAGDGGNSNPAATASQSGGQGGDLRLMSAPQIYLASGKQFGGSGGTGTGGGANGDDGPVCIDPNTIDLSGADTIVRGGDIIMGGGADWKVDLSNMSPGAISATGGITIAVGTGSTVKLTGNSDQVLQANGDVNIYADTILLDSGVTLEEVIDADNIAVLPSRILGNVSLNGPRKVTVQPSVPMPISLTIQNAILIADTYTISASDLAGWDLQSLPSSVTLGELEQDSLELTVTPPASPTNGNIITIVATSQADPTRVAQLEISLNTTSTTYTYAGLEHEPLGQAELSVLSDTLVVSNIGSSGGGVSINVEGNTSWDAKFEPVVLADGAQMITTFTGRRADGTTETIGRMANVSRPDLGSDIKAVYMDFSASGADTYTLKGYDNGQLVYLQEGVVPQPVTPDRTPNLEEQNIIWWIVGLYVLDHADGHVDFKYNSRASSSVSASVTWNQSASIDIDGDDHDDFSGDLLMVIPENAEFTAQSLETVEIEAMNIDSFTIIDETVSSGGLEITEVVPPYGMNDGPSTMYIYGTGFSDSPTVTLGLTQTLDVDFVMLNEDPQRIRAVVPSRVTPGVYDITVETESGRATLANAYEVLDAGTTDDLLSSTDWMPTEPKPMRVGFANSRVGLLVQHLGGTATLDSVTVEFRLDSATGELLGRSLTNLLAPDAIELAQPVTWEPTEPSDPEDDPKDYTVCAIIDPDNEVEETNEDNNLVCQTITVLPPHCLPTDDECNKDTEPPEVDDFAIADDAQTTDQQAVTLDVGGTDYPLPPSNRHSGMGKIKPLEFEYFHAARRWAPVKIGDWVDYDTAQSNYAWELVPSYGMRYMQAWAADNAQNISLEPAADVIDLLPTEQADKVNRDGVKFYRIFLKEGQRFAATMTPESRDPDMYVWWPDGTLRHNVNSTGPETVEFDAPFDGTYQIEIHGPSNGKARYRLEFGATRMAQIDDPVAHSRSNKAIPEDPAVPLDEWPEFYDVSTPPRTQDPPPGSQLYLPLVIR